MSSLLNIQANKNNALKSTGPQTKSGKEISSKNSLKHGILSKDLIIRDESPKELEIFKNNIYMSLQPKGSIEELLVEKIITSAWRLRRILQIENEQFQKNGYPKWEQLNQAFKGYEGNFIKTLSRYEIMLERNFYKALHELQRIQGIRNGQGVLASVAVEINSEV
ncbi:MAG: hypothetical protein KR126chlam4_00196 [Candidatus Anoxychlamydiales bacterium]|nr:hypothetical protein [Candidatus Anoxychlamydiales bacterium]